MIHSFFLHRTNAAPYNRLDDLIGAGCKSLGKALITVLFLLTHAGLVQAATYYVATTGSDSILVLSSHPSKLLGRESAF